MVGYLKRLMEVNDLHGGTYIEPYAGGASVALSLLYEGYARHIKINDKDHSIFAFWHAVLNDTEELIKRYKRTPAAKTLVYLDPPYYVKERDLYLNYYNDDHHRDIASAIKKYKGNWIISYDAVEFIKELYG